MTHKATSEALRNHLNTLPKGLESLFYHILQQLELDDARKTLRIIDCLKTAKSTLLELPLLAFSLLDEYDRDLEFSLRDGLENGIIPDENVLKAQLRGACGGLIECVEGRQYEGFQILEFVHRSVPDILQRSAGRSELALQIEAALVSTNTVDVVSHVCFAAIRLLKLSRATEAVRSICQCIVYIRLYRRIDKPPYHFLEYIGFWIDDRWLDDNETKWLSCCASYPPTIGIRCITSHQPAATKGDNTRIINNNMYLPALSDHMDYIEWKILNDANAMYNSAKRALVGQSVLMPAHWEMFFQNDIFAMDPVIPLIPCVYEQELLSGNDSGSCFLSAWQFFLSRIILGFSHWSFHSPENAGTIIERFLKQGSDPYCRIVVANEESAMSMTICFRELKARHIIPHHYRTSIPVFNDTMQAVIEKCLVLGGSP
jgi:hypothetical protein